MLTLARPVAAAPALAGLVASGTRCSRLPTQRAAGLWLPVQRPRRVGASQRRAAPTTAAALLPPVFTPAAVFDAATLLVLPFYAAMILAPKARLTQRLFSTPAVLTAGAALYGLLLAMWQPVLPRLAAVAQAAWGALVAAASSGGPNALRAALPSMPTFAALFSQPEVTALAWVHLVLLDLLQARWVYHDGVRNGIPIWHSAVLCFMVGPLGLLCHLVTKEVVLRWRGRAKKDEFVVYKF